MVTEILKAIEQHQDSFLDEYSQPLKLDYLFISYIRDAREPSCIFHKDGYFWHGLFHIPIIGNSKITYVLDDVDGSIADDNEFDQSRHHNLEFSNGQIWFFNSSQVIHKIAVQEGERIEICIPNGIREDLLEQSLEGLALNSDGYIDGESTGWYKNKQNAKNHIVDAVNKGLASNKKITRFFKVQS